MTLSISLVLPCYGYLSFTYFTAITYIYIILVQIFLTPKIDCKTFPFARITKISNTSNKTSTVLLKAISVMYFAIKKLDIL